MLRDPSPWMVDARDNTGTHGVYPGSGHMTVSPAKGCAKALYYLCTGGACNRGYKRGERGREAPKSLLEEKLIEASANIEAQKSMCALVSCAKCGEQPRCIRQRPPPPLIDTRRGGVHAQEGGEVVALPRIGGVRWHNTVESTLCRTGE